jgi:hypothetical protein
MQFNNSASTKNENKKHENSSPKKINRPVTFAAQFFFSPRSPSLALRLHRGRERLARRRMAATPGATPQKVTRLF